VVGHQKRWQLIFLVFEKEKNGGNDAIESKKWKVGFVFSHFWVDHTNSSLLQHQRAEGQKQLERLLFQLSLNLINFLKRSEIPDAAKA
jgi:hypothetical protein